METAVHGRAGSAGLNDALFRRRTAGSMERRGRSAAPGLRRASAGYAVSGGGGYPRASCRIQVYSGRTFSVWTTGKQQRDRSASCGVQSCFRKALLQPCSRELTQNWPGCFPEGFDCVLLCNVGFDKKCPKFRGAWVFENTGDDGHPNVRARSKVNCHRLMVMHEFIGRFHSSSDSAASILIQFNNLSLASRASAAEASS